MEKPKIATASFVNNSGLCFIYLVCIYLRHKILKNVSEVNPQAASSTTKSYILTFF